jgi:hypothetical protein
MFLSGFASPGVPKNVVAVNQICALKQPVGFLPKFVDLSGRKDGRHFHKSVPMVLFLMLTGQRIRETQLCDPHSSIFRSHKKRSKAVYHAAPAVLRPLRIVNSCETSDFPLVSINPGHNLLP